MVGGMGAQGRVPMGKRNWTRVLGPLGPPIMSCPLPNEGPGPQEVSLLLFPSHSAHPRMATGDVQGGKEGEAKIGTFSFIYYECLGEYADMTKLI